MNRDTFLHFVRESALVSEERLAEVLSSLPPQVDPFVIGEIMLKKGWLSRFQLQRIWARQPKGLTLGQYRILDELGRGGFGHVYKALHGLMNRVVALKVIAPDLVRDAEVRAMFRREVLAATRLNHPNIVMAYDADEVDDVLFLAMEYVDGPSLQREVELNGPVSIDSACAFMHQAAQALHYAHEKGMVHRDIKPANLLLPRQVESEQPDSGSGLPANGLGKSATVLVKIVDFGLARLCSKGVLNSQTIRTREVTIGTPAYVSPEQARNIHNVDIRADLYSLGCTFYYVLTGQLPFHGETVEEVLEQQMECEPKPLELLRPDIPRPLASAVRRLMAKKPENRFQTPAELISELSFLHGLILRSEPSLLMSRPALASCVLSGPQANNAGLKSPRFSPPHELSATHANGIKIAPVHSPDTPAPGNGGTPPAEKPVAGAGLDLVQKSIPASAQEDVKEDPARISPEPVPALASPVSGQQVVADEAWSELWRTWRSVVETVAADETPRLSELAYRNLYGRLLDAAQSKAAATPPPRQAFFVRLQALAEPWVSLQSLAGLDHKSLISLSRSCLQLDHDLGLRQYARQKRGVTAILVACLIFICLAAWMVPASAVQHLARVPGLDAVGNVLQSHPLLSMVVVGPVVVVGVTGLLTKLLR